MRAKKKREKKKNTRSCVGPQRWRTRGGGGRSSRWARSRPLSTVSWARPSGLGAARGAVALVGPRVGRHRAGAVANAVSSSDEGGWGLVGEAPGVQAARLRREVLAWLHRRRGSV